MTLEREAAGKNVSTGFGLITVHGPGAPGAPRAPKTLTLRVLGAPGDSGAPRAPGAPGALGATGAPICSVIFKLMLTGEGQGAIDQIWKS